MKFSLDTRNTAQAIAEGRAVLAEWGGEGMIVAVATCPICRGSGIVPAGYYASASPSTGDTEKCRTCERSARNLVV